MIALLGSGCSASRVATVRNSEELRVAEVVKDTVVVFREVAVRDTVKEVTTVTVRENEQGDTLRVSTVTDRLVVRDREKASLVKEVVRVERDTVYVEKRDSVFVEKIGAGATRGPDSRGNAVVRVLKWVFAIVVAVTVLVLVIRFGRKGSLF